MPRAYGTFCEWLLPSADCGSPPEVSDATVASLGGSLEGSTATYTCHTGFGLASGGATLTCVNGLWTGTPPTCAGVCINQDIYSSQLACCANIES